MAGFKKLIELDKRPLKGLLWAEWAELVYMLFTFILIFFTYTKLHNPESMIYGRLRVLAITLAMWGVYRMIPCRLMLMLRVTVLMALLSWWYPDTYEFNRMFPNLDHHFATLEQQIFGCQPAFIFSKAMPWPWFSELMDLGYSIYFPIIAVVLIAFLFKKYEEFARAAFVAAASFYIYYVIYIFLPVAGPQYYYKAVGDEQIASGTFPDIGHYFADCQDVMESPGYTDGIFYHLVNDAHAAGERPTAAFPSSHVGVSTILMLLALRLPTRRLFWWLMPFYVLLCLSTVYIYAHYVVDVFGGWISAALLYTLLMFVSSTGKKQGKTRSARKSKSA